MTSVRLESRCMTSGFCLTAWRQPLFGSRPHSAVLHSPYPHYLHTFPKFKLTQTSQHTSIRQRHHHHLRTCALGCNLRSTRRCHLHHFTPMLLDAARGLIGRHAWLCLAGHGDTANLYAQRYAYFAHSTKPVTRTELSTELHAQPSTFEYSPRENTPSLPRSRSSNTH